MADHLLELLLGGLAPLFGAVALFHARHERRVTATFGLEVITDSIVEGTADHLAITTLMVAAPAPPRAVTLVSRARARHRPPIACSVRRSPRELEPDSVLQESVVRLT